MSYIFNNTPAIKYADSPNLDAFGRLRVSQITSLLEIKHLWDKQPLLVDESLNGTATSVFNSSNSEINMTVTNSGDYVIRQTKQRALYQPGKGQLFEASFSDFNLETDVVKRVGYFSSSSVSPYNTDLDGFFLESNGTTNLISFQIWKKGTLIHSASTSTWRSDEIDPSTINWSFTNLCLIDFQWLGVGRVRFGLSLSGITYYFSEHSGTNHLDNVYMKSPNQPIRYEIRSSGGSGQFNQICSQVSLEGSVNRLNKSVGVVNSTERTLPNSGQKYPLIGFRINSGTTFVDSVISDIIILQTTNDNYIATLELDPIITGITYNTIINSPIEYGLGTGGETIVTSGFIISNALGRAGSLGEQRLNVLDNVLRPGFKINGESETLWLCITPLSNNSKFRASININYFD